MPFEEFTKGALDIDADSDDFIARVVELSEDGKVAELAVSDLADYKGNELGGATFTEVEETGRFDDEGYRIVRITSEYPQMVEDAANSVCFTIRAFLYNLKREWTEADEAYRRNLCKSIVDDNGGDYAEIDTMMDEFHSRRRERLQQYLSQKEKKHTGQGIDGGDDPTSDEHGIGKNEPSTN